MGIVPAEVLWSACLSKLRTGNYEGNWPSHEIIRTGNPTKLGAFEPTPTYGMPIWDGKPVKHLVVNVDCGLGDTIQFFRFCKLINAESITIICPCDLWSLFSGYGFNFNEEPVLGDAIIHIMALPKVLGVSDREINGFPYLETKNMMTDVLKTTINDLKKMQFTKIGLCLAGSPFNPRDSERSIDLDKAKPLFDLLPLFNFNKIETRTNSKLLPLPLIDFNHTAHLLKEMNSLITVDTAVAHLAGALGVQTWLLLKDNCDWRWSDKAFTQWYNSMVIIRGSDEELIEQARNLILAS